jgi:hypothetical protein
MRPVQPVQQRRVETMISWRRKRCYVPTEELLNRIIINHHRHNGSNSKVHLRRQPILWIPKPPVHFEPTRMSNLAVFNPRSLTEPCHRRGETRVFHGHNHRLRQLHSNVHNNESHHQSRAMATTMMMTSLHGRRAWQNLCLVYIYPHRPSFSANVTKSTMHPWMPGRTRMTRNQRRAGSVSLDDKKRMSSNPRRRHPGEATKEERKHN